MEQLCYDDISVQCRFTTGPTCCPACASCWALTIPPWLRAASGCYRRSARTAPRSTTLTVPTASIGLSMSSFLKWVTDNFVCLCIYTSFIMKVFEEFVSEYLNLSCRSCSRMLDVRSERFYRIQNFVEIVDCCLSQIVASFHFKCQFSSLDSILTINSGFIGNHHFM